MIDPYIRPLTFPPHIAMILDSFQNDQQRADWCVAKMEDCRREYFEGQLDSIAYVMSSTNKQFACLKTPEARRVAGRQRWSNSGIAKKIAEDEQMFARWAALYKQMTL